MKFKLNAQVRISASGERGQVIGRAEYVNAEPSYYIRYVAADRKALESWWSEGALTEVGPDGLSGEPSSEGAFQPKS